MNGDCSFIVSCVEQSVGEEWPNAAGDFHVNEKNLYNMNLNQRLRDEKSVVDSSLETASDFTKIDLLTLEVSDINQNESENTARWAASQTASEVVLNTSLATTTQLDPNEKVNLFAFFFFYNHLKNIQKGCN